MPFPTNLQIDNVLLQVLVDLGGEATPQQTYPRVADFFPQLTQEDLNARSERSKYTKKWWNMVQWAKNRLKDAGCIDGTPTRFEGTWKITEKGREELRLNPPPRVVRAPDQVTDPSDRRQQDQPMAEPFCSLFASREEAEWVFEFLRQTVELLDVERSGELFALTLPQSGGQALMRLNYGQWLVFGVHGHKAGGKRIEMTFLTEKVSHIPGFESKSEPFARGKSEPEARVYKLAIEQARSLTGELLKAYSETLEFIRGKFENQSASSFRRAHEAAVWSALFDVEIRDRLLSEGINDVPEIALKEKADSASMFTAKTFELLAGLTATPTAVFYEQHQDEFKKEVEEPLRRLFKLVKGRMPQPVLDTFETEKRILAQIRKNDYGVGGAHNYLWGAFYAKGGTRTEGAQLFVTITRDDLEVGFYIGDYGKAQRERFVTNCQLHAKKLAETLEGDFLGANVRYGVRRPDVIPPGFVEPRNFTEWVNRGDEAEPSVRVFLSRDEVLKLTSDELVAKVSNLFVMLFPLVFLALNDDPLPSIEKFLGLSEELVEPEHEESIGALTVNREFLLEQCSKETGFSEELLKQWVRGIQRKGQAIIYGPPGTGKTFVAEKLAKHLIGGGDGICELVQFHPAYAYEDFVQGIRPQSSSSGALSYPLIPGRFLQFCAKSQRCTGPCVLIIDEINRANLARVFGELMYLLEYRNRKVTLAGGTSFQIPVNVRLIGTMNTADRSIALVDHALRRRFAFIELAPQYSVLAKFHEQTGFSAAGLIQVLKSLNSIINDKHYHVGISFFLRPDLKNEIGDIWELEIEPYLEEFFFDQQDKLEPFRWEKIKQKVLA